MNVKFKAEISLELKDAVSLPIAKEMKLKGFLPPERNLGQIWQTETERIVGFYAIDFKDNLVWKFLDGKEPVELSQFNDRLFIYMPNADSILDKMEGWAIAGPDIEGYYKCFLVGSPEKNYPHKNIHEACAAAWLKEIAKPSESKK